MERDSFQFSNATAAQVLDFLVGTGRKWQSPPIDSGFATFRLELVGIDADGAPGNLKSVAAAAIADGCPPALVGHVA